MEQFVLVPGSVYKKGLITQSVTRAATSKVSTSTKPTYQIDSLKKEIDKKLFSKAHSLVEKNFVLSTYQVLKFTNFSSGVETGISLLNFAQQLRRKNVDIPDIYFSLLEAASLSPTLTLNQNAKTKEGGSWVPFKI